MNKPERRWRWTWFRRTIYIGLALIIATMIALPRYFDAAWFDRELKAYLLKEQGLLLQSNGDPKLDFFPRFALRLNDAILRAANSDTPILRAQTLSLSLPWSAINERQLKLDSIHLDTGQLHWPALQQWIEHRMSLDQGPPTPVSLPTLNQSVLIQNVDLLLDEKQPAIRWKLREWRVERLIPGQTLRTQLQLTRLDRPAEFKLALNAQTRVNPNAIELPNLKLELHRTDLANSVPLLAEGALLYRHPQQLKANWEWQANAWPLGLQAWRIGTQPLAPSLQANMQLDAAPSLAMPIAVQGDVFGLQLDVQVSPQAILNLGDDLNSERLLETLQGLNGEVIAPSTLEVDGVRIDGLRIDVSDAEPVAAEPKNDAAPR